MSAAIPMMATKTIPATARRCRENRYQNPGGRHSRRAGWLDLATSRSRTSTLIGGPSVAVPDPRIGETVGDVGQETADDHGERDRQRQRHNQRIVLLRRRVQ